jgi:hypothetical protein
MELKNLLYNHSQALFLRFWDNNITDILSHAKERVLLALELFLRILIDVF